MKKEAIIPVIGLTMLELMKKDRKDSHHSNTIYFPPKRALRGNCKNRK